MPEELWMEVHNTVQKVVIKTIPKKKKCKKAKWLSQIAVKRREAKGKGEKERYTHLNAEFQRIARRDKKAFLSNQCKETEENNRMGKTRNSSRKSEIQGNISCKDGHNERQKWYGPSLLLGRKVMTNLDSILKRRDIANKGPSSQSYDFSSSHVWM